MCKFLYLFVVLHAISHYTDGEEDNAFFRKDYVFISESQSFYKVHTIHRTWQDAKRRCNMEGAQMFYAEDKAEADAVLLHWKQSQPFSWVYVGVSDLLSKGDFETIDGRPIQDVYNNWGPGEPNDADGVEDCVIMRRDGTLNDDKCGQRYPFICKKTLASMEWNILCSMPDLSYIFNGNFGKCYKFHLTPTNWSEAYSICSAEQSYLAILDSQAETDYLVKMTADAPKDKVGGNYLRGVVYLGFHNRDEEGWRTIRGVPLAEAGYSKWGGGQPDGGGKELCGSMFYSGGLNDLGCDHKAFFVCEHDVGSLSQGVDERFGKQK